MVSSNREGASNARLDCCSIKLNTLNKIVLVDSFSKTVLVRCSPPNRR